MFLKANQLPSLLVPLQEKPLSFANISNQSVDAERLEILRVELRDHLYPLSAAKRNHCRLAHHRPWSKVKKQCAANARKRNLLCFHDSELVLAPLPKIFHKYGLLTEDQTIDVRKIIGAQDTALHDSRIGFLATFANKTERLDASNRKFVFDTTGKNVEYVTPGMIDKHAFHLQNMLGGGRVLLRTAFLMSFRMIMNLEREDTTLSALQFETIMIFDKAIDKAKKWGKRLEEHHAAVLARSKK